MSLRQVIAFTRCWLEHFQSRHGSRAGAESAHLQFQSLQHADEEIAQRKVILFVEGKVLAMTETAAGQEDGEVGGEMTAGAAEIAAKQDLGAVEKRAIAVGSGFEGAEEIDESRERGPLDNFELAEHGGVHAVVREGVISLVNALDFGNCAEVKTAQGDHAGGVGLQGQANHVEVS